MIISIFVVNNNSNVNFLVDIFDGDNGEPQITHKRTFIAPISLRNVLNCVKNYAFMHNPFPVILTIENHVGVVQQRIMADIFKEVIFSFF